MNHYRFPTDYHFTPGELVFLAHPLLGVCGNGYLRVLADWHISELKARCESGHNHAVLRTWLRQVTEAEKLEVKLRGLV